MKLFLNTAMPS